MKILLVSFLGKIRSWLSGYTYRLMLSVHERKEWEGFTIYGGDESDFALVLDGIRVLREADLSRFRRAQRAALSVLWAPKGTVFIPAERMLYLNRRDHCHPVAVAVALVDVATQAVLLRRFPNDEKLSSAHRAVCSREVESYLRRLGELRGLTQPEMDSFIEKVRLVNEGTTDRGVGHIDKDHVLDRLIDKKW
ncbi:hypothetical protein HUA74_03945 [Myxococcus sp. CA051A]|uniref:hypothetical protein n=1 Tax=Myxococcus sp. CA051A TaxID=2741739 RepID=UPI00157AD87E|nr:hypothetical protein [Myxococcus sp. CA051A]NTX59803.1 hypothetical protein [Myxococcus sp. CA051A]